MDEYCTPQDIYTHGLPRGVLANPGRTVAGIDTSTGIYTLDGHGFGDSAERTPVTFRVESGGTQQTSVAAGTTYYAERVTDATFYIYTAATGGSPIVSASAGELVVVVAPLPDLREYYSRWVDSFFPGHLVPFQAPIPPFVRGITAQLCGAAMLRATGQLSVTQQDTEIAALAQLERHKKGMPLRDAKATAPANLAVSGSASSSTPLAWGPSSGTLP